ncbi:MAG: YodC family protein [Sphingomonadaceae bacterium]
MSGSLFQIGDVVSLKSGGGAMAVESTNAEVVACVWRDKGMTRRDSFPEACLRHSAGEFDGIGDLIIEGYNATSEEIADLKRKGGVGNA